MTIVFHLQTLVTETLHVVGLNLLLYEVMPRFSTVYALALMYAVCSIPGLLKLIFATSSGGIPKRGIFLLIICLYFLRLMYTLWLRAIHYDELHD